MPAHLRVSLADRPGALAALTRALAAAGANVLSVVVVEREQGRAVDDLVLDWPYERPFDPVVRAVSGCTGARLHGLRHVADLAASRDSDALRQIAAAAHRGLETIVDALPHLLLADWAAAFDRRRPREAVHGTAGSPLPLPESGSALDRSRVFAIGEETLMLLPVRRTTLRVLVGRYDGPAFSRSEVDHADAMLDVAVTLVRVAYRDAETAAPTTVTSALVDPLEVADTG